MLGFLLQVFKVKKMIVQLSFFFSSFFFPSYWELLEVQSSLYFFYIVSTALDLQWWIRICCFITTLSRNAVHSGTLRKIYILFFLKIENFNWPVVFL